MSTGLDGARRLRVRVRPGGTALLLALLAWANPLTANSIRATRNAGMEGTRYGLEIMLLDPSRTPPNDAWAAVGPEMGILEETRLYGRFWIDLHRLVMSPTAEPGTLPFLALMGDAAAPQEVLTFFVTQAPDGEWALGAWVWDDASGQSLLAGWGLLRPDRLPDGSPARLLDRQPQSLDEPAWMWLPRMMIEFEWVAGADGAPGQVAIFRREGNLRVPLVERADLPTGSRPVSHLRIGVQAATHPAGTRGVVRIDELALHRGLLPPVEAALWGEPSTNP